MWQIQFTLENQLPPPPPNGEKAPAKEVWLDAEGREYGFGLLHPDSYWMKFHRAGVFTVSVKAGLARGYPEQGVDSEWFRELFFHIVAPCILQRCQWDCLHASSLLTKFGVVAFCGPAGRGKSTTARGLSDRGGVPYSDDALPFIVKDGQILCAKVPQRLRLREPAASRFRDVPIAYESSEANGPIICDLRSTLEPLAAIYWLEPVRAATARRQAVIEPIPSAESFQLLLSQAHCMSLKDRACNQKMVGNYLALAKRVPLFRLRYPMDLQRMSATLDLLEQHQRTLCIEPNALLETGSIADSR